MKKEKKFIIIILIIAFLLRIYKLGYESYWLDEAISVLWVQQDFFVGLQMVIQDVHQPLYYILLWFWSKLFGYTEIATRMLSVLIDLGSIFLFYKLGKIFLPSRAIIFATFFFSLSPYLIKYSQEARMYSLVVFFCLLSTLTYLNLLKKFDMKNSLFYILSSLALLYTHVFGLLILFVHFLYLLIKKRNLLVKYLAIGSTLFVLYLPGVFIMLFQTAGLENYWIEKPTLISLLYVLWNLAGYDFLFLSSFAIIIYSLLFRKTKPNLLIYLWFFLPIAIVFLFSIFIKPFFQARYLIFCVPALYLIITSSVYNIKLPLRKFLVYGLIFLSLVSVINQAHENNKDPWKEVVDTAISELDENDIIIISPQQHIDPFLYYYIGPECLKHKWQCYDNKKVFIIANSDCCSNKTLLKNPNTNLYLENATGIILVKVFKDSEVTSQLDRYLSNKRITFSKTFGDSISIQRYE
jgi:mannosyltransferase